MNVSAGLRDVGQKVSKARMIARSVIILAVETAFADVTP